MTDDRSLTTTQADGEGPDDGAVAPAPTGRGACFGRFVVLGGLGAGGMGMVLAAYDPELDRRVALKLLHSHRGGGAEGEKARKRLQREAQAMARLTHPNVVTVYDVGVVNEQIYIAMELVEGQTLRHWCAREARPWRTIVDAFAAAGRGLVAAHAAGLVHRDFKPDNVFVGDDDRILVGDFGVASAAARPVEASPAPLEAAAPTHGLTVEGRVIGSPAYMAPEQHDGLAVDARADQYAFCIALYEGLYGERPFRGDTLAVLRVAKEHGPEEPPAGSKVPAWLRAVLVRGMSLDPADRYPSMVALLRALARDPSRTRRRAVAAAAALLLLGIGGWGLLAARSAAIEPCSGAAAQLAGVWDPAARARVEAAFTASGAPDAGATFQRVARALDRYAEGWVAMHTDACRATRVRGEQSAQLLDLRMSCLDQRRGGLRALVEVLAAADRDVVAQGLSATASLAPLGGCADAEALTARVPPPDDPAIRQQVLALQARFDHVRALQSAGKRQEAVELARTLTEEADRIGYVQARASARTLLGRYLASLEQGAEAERALVGAIRLAGEAHDGELLSSALAALAENYNDGKGGYEQGLLAARAAEAVALRGGGDPDLLAEARLSEGQALASLGRYDEALPLVTTAVADYEREYGRDAIQMIKPVSVIGLLAEQGGRLAEARAWDERGLALVEMHYGPEHPDVASFLNNLGNVAFREGKLPDARDFYGRARVLMEKLYGAEHPMTAYTLHNLAMTIDAMGEVDEAAALYERALAIREKTIGAAHPLTAGTLLGLGHVRIKQGRVAEGEAILQRALDAQIAAAGPLTERAAQIYGELGALATHQGRFAEAEAHYQRERDAYRKAGGEASPDHGVGMVDVADSLARQGRCREAAPMLARAIAIVEKALGPDDYRIAMALDVEAGCALRAGKPAQAAEQLERATAIYAKTGLAGADTAESRFRLARALWDAGLDRRRARAEAERVAADLVGATVIYQGLRDEVHAWLQAHPAPP